MRIAPSRAKMADCSSDSEQMPSHQKNADGPPHPVPKGLGTLQRQASGRLHQQAAGSMWSVAKSAILGSTEKHDMAEDDDGSPPDLPLFSMGATWADTETEIATRLQGTDDKARFSNSPELTDQNGLELASTTECRGYVIHPTSLLIRYWVHYIYLLVYFNMLVVPVRVAFDESFTNGPTSEHPSTPALLAALDVIDWVIDGMFLVDIFINFRLGYYERAPGHPALLVMDIKQIRRRYVQFWFWIDLVAILPSLCSNIAVQFVVDDGTLRATELFRILRMIRLFRILKLLRGRKNLDNWTVGRVIYFPLTRRLLRQFWTVWWVCHTLCCITWWIGVLYARFDDTGWIVNRKLSGLEDLEDMHFATQYVASMYWTVMTLSTVGYGDVVMVSDGERLYAIVCMFCGAILFAIVMANTNQLLRELNASDLLMNQRMDSINMYMQHRRLPQQLKTRIRKYYAFYWSRQSVFDEPAVLAALPSHLRREVLLYLHRDMISKVPFFREAETSFILNLVSLLTPVMAAPGDFIIIAGELGLEMFFIDYGHVEMWSASMTTRYQVLDPGSFFGEDALIARERRTANARAVGYAELWSLSRADMELLVVDAPEMAEKMQKMARERLHAQVKMETDALRRLSHSTTAGTRAVLAARELQRVQDTEPASCQSPCGGSESSCSRGSLSHILKSPPEVRRRTSSGDKVTTPLNRPASIREDILRNGDDVNDLELTPEEADEEEKVRQSQLAIMQRSLHKISAAKALDKNKQHLRACLSVRESSVRDEPLVKTSSFRDGDDAKSHSIETRLLNVEDGIERMEKMQVEVLQGVVSLMEYLQPDGAFDGVNSSRDEVKPPPPSCK